MWCTHSTGFQDSLCHAWLSYGDLHASKLEEEPVCVTWSAWSSGLQGDFERMSLFSLLNLAEKLLRLSDRVVSYLGPIRVSPVVANRLDFLSHTTCGVI